MEQPSCGCTLHAAAAGDELQWKIAEAEMAARACQGLPNL